MLSVSDGAAITVSGWEQPVTIAKSGATWMTVGSRFTLASSGLASSSVTATSLTSSQTGTDRYGAYLEVTLSVTIGTPRPLRLRFYDGKPLFDMRWVSTVPAGAKVALTFGSTQTQWFTTLYRYGWEAGEGSQANYGDWSGTWRGETNPMDLSQWPGETGMTSGMYGLPYVSEQLGGVGHYVALSEEIGYEGNWTYQTSATALTVKSGATGAFCITSIGGYEALLEYAKWQHRDLEPRNVVRAATAMVNTIGCMAPQYMGADQQPAYQMAGVNWALAAMDARRDRVPVETFECDLQWYDQAGDYNPRYDLAAAVAAIVAAGYTPGCWMMPGLSGDSTIYSTYPDGVVKENGVPKLYDMGGWGVYFWDHTTAEGVTAIRAMADKVVGLGFKYVRWDIVRTEMWREFGVLKVFSDRLHELDPDFVVETQHPYMQAVADTIRTNDWFGYGTGWDTAAKRRFKVAFCSCPYSVIDCDLLGNNGDWYAARPLTSLRRQARLMFAYGRPIIGLHATADMDALWNDVTWRGYATAYDALPVEVPVREITDGWDTGFSTRMTYSEGSTVEYDANTDNLTFTPGVVATAHDSHIDVTWVDTATGEDGWYIERRVAS